MSMVHAAGYFSVVVMCLAGIFEETDDGQNQDIFVYFYSVMAANQSPSENLQVIPRDYPNDDWLPGFLYRKQSSLPAHDTPTQHH
jgi:hypothetical protein